MNERLKSVLKYTTVFLIGLLVGAFLLESLELYVRPTYRHLIRIYLKTEQEFLASRKARDNKLVESAFHRWVVVNAESDDGFRVFRDTDNDIGEKSYLYPFQLLGLKWMSSQDNIEKGKKIAEGIDRGKLAFALETLGQKKEAENQWQQSHRLTHHATMKATKDFVYSLLEQEKSDLYLRAEDKVLGKQ
jgi:hypothetical protein